MSQTTAPTTESVTKMGNFLAAVLSLMSLKNDAELSRTLGVAPPVISKVRNGTLPLGAVLLIRIHELTGIPTQEIRSMSGSTAGAPNVNGAPA